jgi:Ca2+/Na+ antiporter
LDATLLLSTSAFISGGRLAVSKATVTIDLPFTLLLMALAVLPSAIGKKIYRWQGFLIAGVYLLYLVYIVL